MSIASMEKLTVIGLAKDRENLMRELMRLGVVEITAQDAKLTDDEWSALVSADGNEEEAAKWEARVADVDQAIEVVKRYSTAKKPFIRTRKAVRQRDFDKVMEREREIEKEAKQILALANRMTDVKNERLSFRFYRGKLTICRCPKKEQDPPEFFWARFRPRSM